MLTVWWKELDWKNEIRKMSHKLHFLENIQFKKNIAKKVLNKILKTKISYSVPLRAQNQTNKQKKLNRFFSTTRNFMGKFS